MNKFLRVPESRYINLAIFFIIIGYAILFPHTNQSLCEFSPTSTRHVLNKTSSISEKWAIKIGIARMGDTTFLASTLDALFVGSYCPEGVTKFQFETGTTQWTTKDIKSPNSITFDGNRNIIYVSNVDGLNAVSGIDGALVWHKQSDIFERNPHPTQLLANGKLLVYPGVDYIHRVNVETGELEAIHLPEDTFLYDNDIAFVYAYKAIKAYENGHLLWTFDISSRPHRNPPLPFVDDTILLFRWQTGGSHLTAVDVKTGRLLWEISDLVIVSNVQVSKEIVCFLDANAKLHMINLHNGIELTNIQFEFPDHPSSMLFQPGQIGGSWITISNNLMAIYFQDTGILAVYNITLS